MKILSISNMDIWPFGEGKGIPSIYASQKGFVDRGHQVFFLSSSKNKGMPRNENYNGILIHRFSLPFNISNRMVYNLSLKNPFTHLVSSLVFNLEWLFFQIFGLTSGFRLARKIKPDLIYAHSLTSVFPAYVVSKILKIKLVVRIYGAKDLYWKLQSRLHRIKSFRDYLAFKFTADHYVVTNDGNHADKLAIALGVPEHKISCWRNGVDFDIYDSNQEVKNEVRKELGLSVDSKLIISTSRLLSLYGVDRLIYSLPEVFNNTQDVACVIAGDGPLRGSLEEFVKQHNIASRVLFVDMVGRQKLKRLLNASDIFVLMSRFHNCTNTMWEAMVSGKCIITTKNKAIEQVLTSNDNAILIAQEDADQLARALINLLKNSQLVTKLSNNVRAKAESVLEPWPKRIERELNLLEKIVGDR